MAQGGCISIVTLPRLIVKLLRFRGATLQKKLVLPLLKVVVETSVLHHLPLDLQRLLPLLFVVVLAEFKLVLLASLVEVSTLESVDVILIVVLDLLYQCASQLV